MCLDGASFLNRHCETQQALDEDKRNVMLGSLSNRLIRKGHRWEATANAEPLAKMATDVVYAALVCIYAFKHIEVMLYTFRGFLGKDTYGNVRVTSACP